MGFINKLQMTQERFLELGEKKIFERSTESQKLENRERKNKNKRE